MLIRPATVDDAAAIVAVGRLADPHALGTEASFRELLGRVSPPATERLVAELDGTVVAWAPSGLWESDSGWLACCVLPNVRRRGFGSALFERIQTRLTGLGAAELRTAPSDANGRRFLVARGFDVASVSYRSELDPAAVAPVLHPSGITIATLREVFDRPEELYRVYAEARLDIPGPPSTPWTLDEWRTQTLNLPLIDLDASVVVMEGSKPVSLAWLASDREGGRAETVMTGTLRERRGHGLATLAKVESARRASELGIRRILTYNDRDNEPMRGINRRVGFHEAGIAEMFVKRLR